MMGKLCNICDKCFSSISTYNRHLKRVHKIDAASVRKNIICPNETCKMKFARKITFFKHLKEVHQIDLEIEKKEFSTYAEFLAWKGKIVRETDGVYSKIEATKLLAKGEKLVYYSCNRCGFHNPYARFRKYSTCPSLINVRITENKVLVKFQKTHYGHSVDIPHSFISGEDQLAMAYKLVLGKEENSKNTPLTTLLEEQNLTDIVSDFSDSCSSSDVTLNTCESALNNVSSSILLESNRQEVASLREKLNNISSLDKKELILLESNKQEMALLSEKLNSITSMDKSLSIQIKYYLNAIEHLIEVQAASSDSQLTN